MIPKAEQQRTGPFWEAPDLVKAGYWVFPVNDKTPITPGSFYAASNDMSEVAEWIERGRGAYDLAIGTGHYSRVVVIDADAEEDFTKMKSKYGPPTYTTRRGGHWLFRHPRNGKVVSNKIAPGLDRKGDSGIAVVPPSKGRKWTNGIPPVDSLPVLPREFWSKAKGPTPGERTIPQERKDAASEAIARYVQGIVPGPQGGRHDHLKHLCGVLLSREVSLVDAEDILRGAWTKVGGELANRAEREIPNTLSTTQQAIANGNATGVPSMEEITPGLYQELLEIMGWSAKLTVGSKNRNSPTAKAAKVAGAKTIGPLGERVLIGELIREGIEPPTFLEPEVLIEGAVHWFFGASESGKTWLVLWLIKKRIEAGERVLLLDKENGPEIVGERLELLGCDPDTIDEYLYYHEEPSLRIEEDALEAFTDYLDEVQPVLTVFDSARGFLTSAGLEENSNDDLDLFYEALLKPIRNRRLAAAVLDHIPHDGNHARGAGRKKDLTDIMWNVKCLLPFDEGRVGEVKLRREKGRRGALPETVSFSIGGVDDGFILRRSAGTLETEDAGGLTDSQHKVLDFLRDAGEKGATWRELLAHMNGAKSTLSNAIKTLTRMNRITKSASRYYAKGPMNPKDSINKPNDNGSLRFAGGSHEPNEPGTNGEVHSVHSSLGSEPSEPSAEPALIDVKDVLGEFNRRASGARKNLPLYLRGEITLEVLTRSVLYSLDKNPEAWRQTAALVEEAASDAKNHPVECECEACS